MDAVGLRLGALPNVRLVLDAGTADDDEMSCRNASWSILAVVCRMNGCESETVDGRDDADLKASTLSVGVFQSAHSSRLTRSIVRRAALNIRDS